MRIASGGVQHETNTFATEPTTLSDFIRDSDCGEELSGGETIFERMRGTGTIHGGYIAGADANGVELIPLLCAKAGNVVLPFLAIFIKDIINISIYINILIYMNIYI